MINLASRFTSFLEWCQQRSSVLVQGLVDFGLGVLD